MPWIYPQLLWRIPTTDKVIYLTFDDGPVPGPTEFVLETLSQFGAQGTFFCIGNNVVKNRNLFSDIITKGHEVGNHTYDHMNGWRNSDKIYRDNVDRCAAALQGNGLFRPPFGRIKRSQIRQLRDFRIVMWDVLTHDYSATLKSEACLRGSIAATRPGSIVVFHDSYKAERNLNFVLPRFLQHFSERGYSFHSLSRIDPS